MDLRSYINKIDLELFEAIKHLKNLNEINNVFQKEFQELATQEKLGAYQIVFIRDVMELLFKNFEGIFYSIEKEKIIKRLSGFELQIIGLQHLLGEDKEND